MADTNVKKLSVKFEGDTTKLVTATKLATQAFNDSEKAIKSLENQMNKFGAGTDLKKQDEYANNLKNGIDEANKSLEKLYNLKRQLAKQDEDNKLTAGYQQLEEKIDTIQKKTEEWQRQLDSLNSERIEATFDKVDRAIEKTDKDMLEMRSVIEVLNKALQFNPESVELLTIKQNILTKEVARTNTEANTLQRYLNQLEQLGLDKNSKEFINIQNAIKGARQEAELLRIETATYQQALTNANAVTKDITERGNRLREALQLDPKNVQLTSQYTSVLQEELTKTESTIQSVIVALRDIDSRGFKDTNEQVVNLTTTLADLKSKQEQIKEQMYLWSDEGQRMQMTLESARETLSSIANESGILKQAFEIDPTNIDKGAEYFRSLEPSINRCNTQLFMLNDAIKDMDTGKVKKVPDIYRQLKQEVNNVRNVVKNLEKDQSRSSESAIKFANAMDQVKATTNETSRVASILKKQLELDPTNTKKQTEYTTYLKTAIKTCADEEERLNVLLREQNVTNVQVLNGEYANIKEQLNNVVSLQQQYNNDLKNVEKIGQNFSGYLSNTEMQLSQIGMLATRVYGELKGYITDVFENAMSYESNVASIRKVVHDLTQETINDLKQLSATTGVAFDSVAEYATIGATLGIAQKDLKEFTSAMIDLEVATDGAISGDTGAAAVARLLNQFNIGAEAATNFGSAMTYVGDQFAAQADEILQTASNMGGLSAITGVTIQDLIGLSAEMKNLGISTASGASAISKVFLKIEQNVKTGGDSLETYAKVAGETAESFASAWNKAPTEQFLKFINGLKSNVINEISEAVKNNSKSLEGYANALEMSTDEFKKSWLNDSTSTFDKYIDSLENMSDETNSAVVVLDELGLTGVRVAQTLLKLSGNGEVVSRAIEDANEAWDKNTNLMSKANEMYGTTEYKLKAAKEAINQAMASIGDVALPLVKNLADIVNSLAQTFSKLPDGFKTFSLGALGLTTAFSGMIAMSAKIERFTGLNGPVRKGLTAIGKTLMDSTAMANIFSSTLSIGIPAAFVTAAFAIAKYKVETQLANDKTYQLSQTIGTLTRSANDNFAKGLVDVNSQVYNYKKNNSDLINEIQTLSDKFTESGKKININSKEYEELKNKVDEYNRAIGNNENLIITVDETTGAITNQKGEVVKLTNEWKNYYAELTRQEYLTSHLDEYNNAIGSFADAEKELTNKRKELKEALIGYGIDTNIAEEITNWKSGYKDVKNVSEEAKDIVKELYETLYTSNSPTEKSIISNLLNLMNDTIGADKLTDYLSDIVDKYEQIAEVDSSGVINLINSFGNENTNLQEGLKTFTDMRTEMDNTVTAMEEIYEQMNLVTDKSSLEYRTLRDQYDILKENLNTTIDEMSNMDKISETFGDSFSTTGEEIKDEYVENDDSVFKKLKSKGEEIASDIKTALENITKSPYYGDIIMRVTYEDSGFNGTSTVGNSSNTYGSIRSPKSDGFNLGNMLKVPKLASGGYSSGGVVLNANFSITNGANINKSTVQGWASTMVDIINDELGRRF